MSKHRLGKLNAPQIRQIALHNSHFYLGLGATITRIGPLTKGRFGDESMELQNFAKTFAPPL